MKGYLMGILCAAILCGVTGSIGTAGQGTRRLVGGIFLALAVLKPLGTMELPELDLTDIRASAEVVVRDGMEQAEASKAEIISGQIQTYIWSIAEDLGLPVEVSVELGADGLPVTIELTGSGPPAERERLCGEICAGLGLEREAVVWSSGYQSGE